MKKTLKLYLFSAIFLFGLCPVLHASPAGNSYQITMLCLGDAGSYCKALTLDTDKFIFAEDDSDFDMDNMTFGTGSYENIGLMIEAEYTETMPLVYKYEFDITAINFFDFMLIGTINILYASGWDYSGWDWKNEEEATAVFVGFSD